MFSTFQKAVLAAIVGGALLIALVAAAKGPATLTPFSNGGTAALTTPVNTGGIAPGVVTTGDATVKLKPDVAIITVGAVAQASTAAEAQSLVAARVEQILKRARELGVNDKDTKSAGYQIQPQYASGPDKAPRITGYQATQQILLTFRNVDVVGKALDVLVQGDGSNTLSIRLTLDDPKSAQAEARRLAIEDARAKADAMAKTAGVRLGRVIAISDAPSPVSGSADSSRGFAPAAAGQTQIPIGELDIVVRVQVQFEIQ